MENYCPIPRQKTNANWKKCENLQNILASIAFMCKNSLVFEIEHNN